MLLACVICMATCGSGVKIIGIAATTARLLTVAPGLYQATVFRASIGSSVAARGSIKHRFVVQLVVINMSRSIALTMWALGWPVRFKILSQSRSSRRSKPGN